MLHDRFHSSAATLLLVLVACGAAGACGDDSHKKAIETFVGTWTITTGGLSATCPGLNLPLATSEGTKGQRLVFTAGTDSDLLVERGECRVKFDVKGNIATAQAGQSCPLTFADLPMGALGANPLPIAGGAQIGLIFGVAKAVFTANGTTGTYEQVGPITLPVPIPLLSGCTYGINVAAEKNP